MKRIITAIGTCAMLFLGASSAQADYSKPPGDGACPAGNRLAEAWEVKADADKACAALEEWDIVRLAGGASLSGPGYKCQVIEKDTRTLGASLCVSAPELAAAGDYTWSVNGRAGGVTTLKADGTCSNSSSKMSCVWKVKDGKNFTLNWNNGRFVDSMVLSEDGKTIDGKNQLGNVIKGVKK